MLIKCDKCGYENFPQHRFCGMCATALRSVQGPVVEPAHAPQLTAAQPVSSRAAVRLERAPMEARSLSYLLEDEPAASHRGRYMWLLVLLLAGAAVAWHWRGDLGSAVARISGRDAGQANSAAQAVPGSSADVAGATSATAGRPAETPNVAGSAPAQASSAQTPPPAASTGDTTQASPDQAAASGPAQPGDTPAEAPAPAAAPATDEASSPKAQVRAARASATMTAADMEADGEKYLYGNGVAENCGRARKDLLAAAGRSNAKAQNVMGTMYATGHCATRDLPTAYRWFGRALRQDPGNTRIEQDLKVLWNQMTPEERQQALRGDR